MKKINYINIDKNIYNGDFPLNYFVKAVIYAFLKPRGFLNNVRRFDEVELQTMVRGLIKSKKIEAWESISESDFMKHKIIYVVDTKKCELAITIKTDHNLVGFLLDGISNQEREKILKLVNAIMIVNGKV